MGDDYITAVARGQKLRIPGIENVVNPRHFSIPDKHVIIEHSPEETGDAAVIVTDAQWNRFVMIVVQEIIDTADAAPVP